MIMPIDTSYFRINEIWALQGNEGKDKTYLTGRQKLHSEK